MTIHLQSRSTLDKAGLRLGGFFRQLLIGVAMMALALVTGMSLRSAENILPSTDDAATPYLGI